jgi:Protein of unknown function (DUF4038)/Putative collagen-binding domain of a collagenase
VAGAAGAGPVFPLRASDNGRYLVDRDGVPFRLNTEAAWFLSTQASASDVDTYLDDRRGRGFTACIVMAMVHQGGYLGFPNMPARQMANAPKNLAGHGPFTTPGDFSTVNDAYWQHIDHIVTAARDRGMAVLLAYAYLGYEGGSQGWWGEINEPRNDRTVMFDFGRTLATRYPAHPNVIWYTAGDFAPPPGSEGAERVLASVEGIRSVLPDALFAAEMSSPDDLSTDHPDFRGVLDLESFYGYGPGAGGAVYETARRAWAARSPKPGAPAGAPPVAKPAFVGEPPYEGTAVGGSGARTDIRRAQWYAVLGGGTAGQNFGTSGVWNWITRPDADCECTDFRTALDSPGTRDMQHQFALYDQLPWFDLVPAGTEPGFAGRQLVTQGQGDGIDHIAAAVTADHRWLLAYVPPGRGARTFGVDLAALDDPARGGPGRSGAVRGGAVRARWYDPSAGTFAAAGAGSASAGSHRFGTPGDNASGESDWVLVLDV